LTFKEGGALITLIIAIVLLAVLGLVFLFSLIKSKGVYDEYLEMVDKKDYAFKDLMPIGLFLNEKINMRKILPAKLYKYLYKYESAIKGRIIELYGIKYTDYYLMIHNGNKIAICLTVATGAALLSVIMGFQGDSSNCGIFLFASLAALIGLPLLSDKGLNDKIEKRRLELQKEFPEFINKLTLLVNAGMTISKAWEKIVVDNKKNTPLYNEMHYALGEIRAGKPEAIAYEEFGRRCKIKEIIRFVSVIVLNLKKGGADVVPVLKVQAMECWEMRKNVAKRLGEEAATKILIPLMIMFVGILIIVATPAIMSFGNI
jgi:tight adherence protein C